MKLAKNLAILAVALAVMTPVAEAGFGTSRSSPSYSSSSRSTSTYSSPRYSSSSSSKSSSGFGLGSSRGYNSESAVAKARAQQAPAPTPAPSPRPSPTIVPAPQQAPAYARPYPGTSRAPVYSGNQVYQSPAPAQKGYSGAAVAGAAVAGAVAGAVIHDAMTPDVPNTVVVAPQQPAPNYSQPAPQQVPSGGGVVYAPAQQAPASSSSGSGFFWVLLLMALGGGAVYYFATRSNSVAKGRNFSSLNSATPANAAPVQDAAVQQLVSSAQSRFMAVQRAFAKNDLDSLQSYLSNEFWYSLEDELRQREGTSSYGLKNYQTPALVDVVVNSDGTKIASINYRGTENTDEGENTFNVVWYYVYNAKEQDWKLHGFESV